MNELVMLIPRYWNISGEIVKGICPCVNVVALAYWETPFLEIDFVAWTFTKLL